MTKRKPNAEPKPVRLRAERIARLFGSQRVRRLQQRVGERARYFSGDDPWGPGLQDLETAHDEFLRCLADLIEKELIRPVPPKKRRKA